MTGLRRSAVTVAVASGLVVALGGGAAGQNLVAHWEFEQGSGDTAYDSAGTNNGTLMGGMGDANWVAGKVGSYALSFDGSDDYVSCAIAPTIDLADRSFSVAAWARRGSLGTDDFILGQGTSGANTELHFGYRADNRFAFAFYSDDLNNGGHADDTWHHWVGTYDSTTFTQTLYKDGVQIQQRTAGAHFQGTGEFYIGRRPAGEYFIGDLDDCRVYDSVLDTATIQGLYAEGTPSPAGATAGDPDENDTTFGADDRIYVMFDVDTSKSMDAEAKTGVEMDVLFPLTGGHTWGTSSGYTIWWIDARTLVIVVNDTTGATIDFGDTITVDSSADIRSTGGASPACTGTTPPLTGDWGEGSFMPAQGFVLVEVWDSLIGEDYTVRTTSGPPGPSWADYSVTCEGISEGAAKDNYNSRLRGYIYPPEGGDYLFHLAADDVGELWLSYDDNPANMRMIVDVNSWTNFDFSNAVESGPVYLEAGMRYYFEAVHKEGAGGDHIRVGWTPPTAGEEKPITGAYLSPWHIAPAVKQVIADDPAPEDSTYGVDDTVTIAFLHLTNQSATVTGSLSGAEMDAYFQLSGGHTWGACDLLWLDERTLEITVSSTAGATVDIGDTLTVTPASGITDRLGLIPAWTVAGTIAGNWGLAGATGLVAHWRLDETTGNVAQDSVGSNHGLVYGAPILGRTGKVANAYEFDGDSDFVDIGSVGISGAAARTIAGWAKANSTDHPDWTGVFGFAPLSAPIGGYFDVQIDNGSDDYVLHLYGTQHPFMAVDYEWHHFAATYDGTTVIGYLDGLQVFSETETLVTVDSFAIANRPSYNNCFEGLVDDVRVYNVALTDPDVLALYQMGRPVINTVRAHDPDYGDIVLGPDDTITLTFDTDMNGALDTQTLSGGAMDGYFVLGGGHIWGTVGNAYSVSWPDVRTLMITVVDPTDATIEIGDTITIDASAGIQDAAASFPALTQESPPITGDWGLTPEQALVAHWEFEDYSGTGTEMIAWDSTGNGNDGTLTNMPGDATNWVTGKVGDGALDFHGTGDYVQIGGTDVGPPWTVMLWVNRRDAVAAAATLMDSSSYALRLEQWNDTNEVGVTHHGDADHNFGYEAPVGEWTHLTFVGTSSETRLYVDGLYEDTVAAPIGAPMRTLSRESASGQLEGALDDVRVYGMPLSDSYIEKIFRDMRVSIQATDPDAAEDDISPETGTFTVTRTGDTATEITVNFSIGGDATPPPSGDYDLTASAGTLVPAAGTLTIPADQGSVTITVTPVDDTEVELPETVVITILPGDEYFVGTPDSDTVTITDDDVPEAFTIESPPSPADGATEVDPTVDITLQWTAPVDPLADDYTITVALDSGFTNVVDQVTQSGTSYVITGSTLGTDEHVYWTVVASNDAGTTEITDAPLEFYTPDTIPPWVTRSDPKNLDGDVDTSSEIRVYFNERMEEIATKEAAEILGPDGQIVPGAWSLDASGTVLVFKADDRLEDESTYTVTIDATKATDFVGNPLDCDKDGIGGELLEDGHAFSFTTWEALRGLAQGEGCVPGSGPAGAWLAIALGGLMLGRGRDHGAVHTTRRRRAWRRVRALDAPAQRIT